MIKVTIVSSELRELSGVGKSSGKPYALRIQSGYAHVMDRAGTLLPFPEKFELILDRDQAAYGPGEYQLHPSAIYVDKDGRLSCTPRLAPLKRAS